MKSKPSVSSSDLAQARATASRLVQATPGEAPTPPEKPQEYVRFSVRTGSSVAISGDLARASEATPVEVTIAVEAIAGAAASRDVRVTLVRNGAVVSAWTGPPPFRTVHRDVFDGSPTFYRLDVRGPGRLLSNPIFVRRL